MFATQTKVKQQKYLKSWRLYVKGTASQFVAKKLTKY